MLNTRRQFLKGGALTTVALGLPGAARSAESRETAKTPRLRNIIHLVADGMSSGMLACADYFSVLRRRRSLKWLEFAGDPATGHALVNMRSLNSYVTDSAAASSSWGSGSRVANAALNILPDGRKLRTLYDLLRAAGWARGLVTTTEITHATPAGFCVNVRHRNQAEEIADQYLDRRVEVLLGGGRKYFDPGKREDKRDLALAYREAGYEVLTNARQLAAASPGKPWLGTFHGGHLPYSLDQLHNANLRKTVPTLANMTRRALQKLERSDHFILQVEGGRVDHAGHANDIAAGVHDMLAFDDAIEVCLEFQRRSPETLIVLTTDHGTANPGLNGTGTGYRDSPDVFAHTLKVTASFEAIKPQLEKAGTTAQAGRILKATTGYAAAQDKLDRLMKVIAGKGEAMYDGMNSASGQLGQLMANRLGVGFTSTAHTADYVPLLAKGPGAERFSGFLQNTDVFPRYLALAGIDFRNPSVPLMAECGPSASEAEEYRV